VGRQIAAGRAVQAMECNVESGPIVRDEAWCTLCNVAAQSHYYIKSTNNPVLTPIEIKLIKGEKK